MACIVHLSNHTCNISDSMASGLYVKMLLPHQLVMLLRLHNHLHALLMPQEVNNRLKLMCQLIPKLLQHHDTANTHPVRQHASRMCSRHHLQDMPYGCNVRNSGHGIHNGSQGHHAACMHACKAAAWTMHMPWVQLQVQSVVTTMHYHSKELPRGD